jgi:hypothetical protein
MRSILGFLLISLTGINAYGQTPESRAFLHDFFGQSTKIVYMDRLWAGEIKRMEKALAQDMLQDVFGNRGVKPSDRLVLTKEERSYIQHQLGMQFDVVWADHLFENAQKITKATVDSIFSDRNRGWTYFDEHYGPKLYSFSNPIFIRDHSLCIFYSGYSCGHRCGEGKLMILRKKNATWVSWMELYRWVS